MEKGEDRMLQKTKELELRKSLEQPVCEGGGIPLLTFFLSIGIFIILPIVLLSYTAGESSSSDIWKIFVGVSVGLLGFGFFLFIWSIRPLLLRPPPAPPARFPLTREPTNKSPPKSAYVLVNPKGGKGASVAIFEQKVKPKFEAAGIKVTKVETQYSGHCRDICNTISLDDHDTIIAIGGDGTFHECVDGMLKRADKKIVKLGLIPGGSGNSFLSDFQLEADIEQSIDTIIEGYISGIDVIDVRYGPEESHQVYSINVIGYTEDHCLSAINIDGWRWIFKQARYDICAFWGILKHKVTPAVIYCDGVTWKKGGLALFITNTQHIGNHMRACPNASLDSGTCQVACVDGTRAEVLRQLSLIKNGAHHSLSELKEAKKVTLRLPNHTGLFNLDGEIFVHHHDTIEMTVLEQPFSMYVPTKQRFEALLGKKK